MKEDRALFARLLVAAKSRPDISLNETIGTCEFSVVPRALFGADGTLLPASSKSDLMHILEKLPGAVTESTDDGKKVAIVDGMAELHSMDKPPFIRTCLDLSKYFIKKFDEKYGQYDEAHLVFDRYNVK